MLERFGNPVAPRGTGGLPREIPPGGQVLAHRAGRALPRPRPRQPADRHEDGGGEAGGGRRRHRAGRLQQHEGRGHHAQPARPREAEHLADAGKTPERQGRPHRVRRPELSPAAAHHRLRGGPPRPEHRRHRRGPGAGHGDRFRDPARDGVLHRRREKAQGHHPRHRRRKPRGRRPRRGEEGQGGRRRDPRDRHGLGRGGADPGLPEQRRRGLPEGRRRVRRALPAQRGDAAGDRRRGRRGLRPRHEPPERIRRNLQADRFDGKEGIRREDLHRLRGPIPVPARGGAASSSCWSCSSRRRARRGLSSPGCSG